MVPENYKVNKSLTQPHHPQQANTQRNLTIHMQKSLCFAWKNNCFMHRGYQYVHVDHRPVNKVQATRFLESSPFEGGEMLNFSPSPVDDPLEGEES